MATFVARGCAQCNKKIAHIEDEMARNPQTVDTAMFRRLQPPHRVFFDGEDMTAAQVTCVITGGNGALLRNATVLIPGLPGEHAILCPCGSELVQVELWYGRVTLEPVAPRLIAG